MHNPYRTLTMNEILNEAERHDDPLIRELALRLDAATYQLFMYRQYAHPNQSNPSNPSNPDQLKLFTEN